MFDDPLFNKLHVSESDGSLPEAVTFQLFEIWRRDALLAASCSTTTRRLERVQSQAKMEVRVLKVKHEKWRKKDSMDDCWRRWSIVLEVDNARPEKN